jgi:flavodoxin/Pyruvate/2-oxoacid:ferredoxin oxidoreductase delta subunit
MNTTIYYFTGTGNSLKIAKDLADNIKDSNIIQINKQLVDSKIKPAYQNIGIVFPVYADGVPLIIERFIDNLQLEKNAYVFAVTNFGGAAGMALYQLETLLAKKDIALSAAFEILMPDNTQIMFPPLSPEEQEDCLKASLKQIPDIARAINSRDKNLSCIESLREKGKSWKRHPFEPNKMEKDFWCNDQCDGCGLCEKVCPVRNIAMKNGKPAWQGRCEQCLACMQWCPKESIQFGKRTGGGGRYHNPYIKVQELFQKQ